MKWKIYQQLSDYHTGRVIDFSPTRHVFDSREAADRHVDSLNNVYQVPIGDYATFSRYSVVQEDDDAMV
tara:strand:- start:6109 stop:6315 length:207 start_codon:yes stop_codon:yes gene_type:complete